MNYFKFYVNDFLVGTSFMTAAEIGLYIRMLCYQWDKEFIPNDPPQLAIMFGGDITPAILEKFEKSEYGLFNARLANERCKAQAKVTKMRLNGSKGAEKRWLGNMFTPAPPKTGEPIPDFYIGIHGQTGKPSQWMKENAQTYVEAQIMKYKLGVKGETVLSETMELLDSDYNHYDFTNANHVKNAFKVCLGKIVTAKPSNKKMPLHGSNFEQ